jgi:hypothetical protein
MRRPAVSMLPASCLREAGVATSEWCAGLGGGRLDEAAMNGRAAAAAEGSLSSTLLRRADDTTDLILAVGGAPAPATSSSTAAVTEVTALGVGAGEYTTRNDRKIDELSEGSRNSNTRYGQLRFALLEILWRK